MRSFNGDIIELGKKQATLFEQNNQVYMDCLVKFDSPRHIMVLAYGILVGMKKLTPIEKIGSEEKNQLWELTKEFAAGKLEKDKAIELSKALYVLEYYLQ